MTKLRNFAVMLITGLLIGAGIQLSIAQGPLTVAPNLRVRTDNNGYLMVTSGAVGTQGPLTNFGNIRIRTDSNGYLMVTIAGGSASFTADGDCSAPPIREATDTDTGIDWTAANTLAICTNGTTRLSVSTTAVTSTLPLYSPDGTVGAPSLTFTSDSGKGWFAGTDYVGFADGGSERFRFDGTGATYDFAIASAGALKWGVTSPDLFLYRDAANALAQRNGTNAQTFRIYNTFTSSTNYEVGQFVWSGNTFIIQTTFDGSGSARALRFDTGGTARWSIGATTGHLLAGTDNTYDIGASGANRPRDIYLAGGVKPPAGGTITFVSSSVIRDISDGVIALRTNAETAFTRLILGTNDTTTSGVSLVKEVGHLIEKRGDGSTGTLTVANVGANSCGTTAATIVGTDKAFRVTVGATAGTECRVTFVSAWTTAPVCIGNNETTANLMRTDSPTTTTIDLAGTFNGGDVISVKCDGY